MSRRGGKESKAEKHPAAWESAEYTKATTTIRDLHRLFMELQVDFTEVSKDVYSAHLNEAFYKADIAMNKASSLLINTRIKLEEVTTPQSAPPPPNQNNTKKLTSHGNAGVIGARMLRHQTRDPPAYRGAHAASGLDRLPRGCLPRLPRHGSGPSAPQIPQSINRERCIWRGGGFGKL